MHHMQYIMTRRFRLGGDISMVLVITHCWSIKQNFNTKNSTKSDLAEAIHSVLYNRWCILFMHHHIQKMPLPKSTSKLKTPESILVMDQP